MISLSEVATGTETARGLAVQGGSGMKQSSGKRKEKKEQRKDD